MLKSLTHDEFDKKNHLEFILLTSNSSIITLENLYFKSNIFYIKLQCFMTYLLFLQYKSCVIFIFKQNILHTTIIIIMTH